MREDEEIVKYCKIHGYLTRDNVALLVRNNIKDYLYCIFCRRESSKRSYNNNRVKILKSHKDYRDKNKDKIALYQKKWYIKNKYSSGYKKSKLKYDSKEEVKERKKIYLKNKKDIDPIKYRENSNKKSKKQIEILSNCYVRSMIRNRTSLKCSDIPEELTEAHRVYILIKRQLREIKNVTNSKNKKS